MGLNEARLAEYIQNLQGHGQDARLTCKPVGKPALSLISAADLERLDWQGLGVAVGRSVRRLGQHV